jgi:phenylalanyl-tRNA synthetase beta chain
MNSLVSYNWLKHYVDLNKIEPEEFAKKISLCGPAVEKIWRRDDLLQNVVVGKIISVDAHPNADKLRICMVDVGVKKPEARSQKPEANLTQIVCGGSNLSVGQYVALAKVGARVQWHGEGEPVTLEAAKLRGVESFGMICGANEIGLGDAFPHEEKEILDFEKELGKDAMKIVKPGTPVADLLGLSDDVLMDIEVTGNRVDAMGMIGMAREASAILGRKFLWKPAVMKKGQKPEARSQKPNLSITIHDKTLCPRYMGVRITGIKNDPSPWWMKQRLVAGGLKPISLLVDITNYILLEYAQPMHVFDVAKLRMKGKTPEIHVRRAKDGEKMKALDGKEYELNAQALVIADAEGPVAVAGIMGGEHSGAYDDTTDIVFECAAFDSVSIRRTSRR